LVNPTLDAFTDAEDAKITSVEAFCKNSTCGWCGKVKLIVEAAPTAVEMLTVSTWLEVLHNLTQVASLILEADPAVVGIATSVAINFVLCIILQCFILYIYCLVKLDYNYNKILFFLTTIK
jgi:chromate transport protein ChrA